MLLIAQFNALKYQDMRVFGSENINVIDNERHHWVG